MKPPWEWDESDVRALVANQVPEGLTLDYKACDALGRTESKKKEISKDVSAFANSAGGTIVYGVSEDKHLPTALDVGYLPADLSKEWLEQVINASIQRRIDGVRINSVRLTGSPGRVLHAVSIPQSVRAPHMASDHRFYKRFNFECVPMEEYEVRDTAHRGEAPDLKLTFELYRPTPEMPVIELVALISNDAPEPANHAVIRLYVDARLTIISSAGLGEVTAHELTTENGTIPVNMLSANWGPQARMPIWEGEAFRLTERAMQIGLPRGPGEYTIGWRLTSPRMNPKSRFYSLVRNGAMINVLEHS